MCSSIGKCRKVSSTEIVFSDPLEDENQITFASARICSMSFFAVLTLFSAFFSLFRLPRQKCRSFSVSPSRWIRNPLDGRTDRLRRGKGKSVLNRKSDNDTRGRRNQIYAAAFMSPEPWGIIVSAIVAAVCLPVGWLRCAAYPLLRGRPVVVLGE